MNQSGAYFWDGFQHCIFASAFALGLYLYLGGKLKFSKSFWAALVMGASALFFLPPVINHVPMFNWRIWLFLRYPLPDWDILFLGMGWHRYFIFHSLILPLVLFYEISPNKKFFQAVTGALVGVSSHLIWDGLTCSMMTPIVFYRDACSVAGYWAKGWLVINGALIMGVALMYVKRNVPKLQPEKEAAGK